MGFPGVASQRGVIGVGGQLSKNKGSKTQPLEGRAGGGEKVYTAQGREYQASGH